MDSLLLNSSIFLPPYSLQTEHTTHVTIVSTHPPEEPLSFYTQNIPHPIDSSVNTISFNKVYRPSHQVQQTYKTIFLQHHGSATT